MVKEEPANYAWLDDCCSILYTTNCVACFYKFTLLTNNVTVVTIRGNLQPDCLADQLLTGLGQPQINR
jgi:hypothetical protein